MLITSPCRGLPFWQPLYVVVGGNGGVGRFRVAQRQPAHCVTYEGVRRPRKQPVMPGAPPVRRLPPLPPIALVRLAVAADAPSAVPITHLAMPGPPAPPRTAWPLGRAAADSLHLPSAKVKHRRLRRVSYRRRASPRRHSLARQAAHQPLWPPPAAGKTGSAMRHIHRRPPIPIPAQGHTLHAFTRPQAGRHIASVPAVFHLH